MSIDRKSKVLVIDSGIGGRTILEVLQLKHPEVSYVYASDDAHFPYGNKTDAVVREVATRFAKFMTEKEMPDVLIVACNTACTVALDEIRSAVKCPVIGVVPAIKPAALISKSKVIGLLATSGTIFRPYIDSLIRDFASDCQVVRVGSQLLVELAEKKFRGSVIDLTLVQNEIQPLLDTPHLDVVILGCTHFPWLRHEFEIVANMHQQLNFVRSGKPVNPSETCSSKNVVMQWIDSADAIAKRLQTLLNL